MELALILPVKLHASSHKRILVLSNIGTQVGICQSSVVARDALLQLHQAATRIIRSERRTDLKSLIPQNIILYMSGISCPAQQGPRCVTIQRGFLKRRKRATSDNNRSTNMSSSSVMSTDKSQKERSATINAVFKSLQFSSSAPARGGCVHFHANRSNVSG